MYCRTLLTSVVCFDHTFTVQFTRPFSRRSTSTNYKQPAEGPPLLSFASATAHTHEAVQSLRSYFHSFTLHCCGPHLRHFRPSLLRSHARSTHTARTARPTPRTASRLRRLAESVALLLGEHLQNALTLLPARLRAAAAATAAAAAGGIISPCHPS